MRWDMFCRVIDNHGDIGVCWRLAADLAARGEHGAPVGRRRRGAGLDGPARRAAASSSCPGPTTAASARARRRGDRGLRLRPAAGLRRAHGRSASRPPLWINLEYLSAEAYVERCHGLPSPQLSGPGAGLTKWFFYPGFSAAHRRAAARAGPARAAPDASTRAAWLQAQGIGAAARRARRQPVLLRHRAPLAELAAGAGATRPRCCCSRPARRRSVRGRWPPAQPARCAASPCPGSSQPDYDRLLWACDLNFVRGEDSWCARSGPARPSSGRSTRSTTPRTPPSWTPSSTCAARRRPGLARPLRRLWRVWNGLAAGPAVAGPSRGLARAVRRRWRDACSPRPTWPPSCCGFVAEKR